MPTMPGLPAADTIRILVATDNHVGYAEKDAIRGDDSWKSFHEVMCLARDKDVDMVLLAGDLFHDNKPSRKSMFNVMRSLRMNCYGERPCELELLSDSSEIFQGYIHLLLHGRQACTADEDSQGIRPCQLRRSRYKCRYTCLLNPWQPR